MNNIELDLDILKELTGIPGVSGREQLVAEAIQHHLTDSFASSTDSIGNLVAHFPGEGPKIMLLAHMDEVGLIVQRILPGGFLQVERIGGISVRSLFGSRMVLQTRSRDIPASFGVYPGHLDQRQKIKLSDCYVDINVSSKEEALALGVQVGDVLTWEARFKQMKPAMVSSKALDDRLGCFILNTIADLLVEDKLPVDLYLGFMVREEIAFGASKPMIEAIMPDIVIGVDGTLTFDTPELANIQNEIRLGKGPVLKWMDAIRGKSASFLPDLDLNRRLQTLAEKHQIPLQHEVMTGLSTAVSQVPYMGAGIRTAALSFPLRYHHTPIECADLRDVDALVLLLIEYLRSSNY